MVDFKDKFDNVEEKLVLMIARSLVYPEEKREIENTLKEKENTFNWDRFIRLAGYHQLLPLAYITLKDKRSLFSMQTYRILKDSYFINSLRNMFLRNEFLTVAKSFNECSISFTPLKGLSFLGRIYQDINCRQMADIDILVKGESLNRVENILVNMGYDKNLQGLKEEYWRTRYCHVSFLRKFDLTSRISLEVHWDLDLKRRRIQDAVLPKVWSRLEEEELDGQRIRFLSWEDTILSLALHKRRSGNNLILKEVCDLVCIINKFSPEIDWDYIIKYSRISRMQASLYFILLQVNLFFDNLLTSDISRQLNVPYWKKKAMKRLILRNTFCDNPNFHNLKNIYLKAHFLLYDNLWEPMDYIFNIPKEEFAKFYGLKPYEKRTNLLYRIKLLYIFYKSILSKFRSLLFCKGYSLSLVSKNKRI